MNAIFFNILKFLFVFIICGNTSFALSNQVYNFAGVLPVVKDQDNQAWLYFDVEYKIKEPQLAIFGGSRETRDKSSADTAIRELKEESLDVLDDYITINTLNKKTTDNIDYHLLFLFNVRLYLTPIDYKLDTTKTCEYFLSEYHNRRYKKPENYKKLALSQRESYEIRRVKVTDLIDFLKSPEKNDYKLNSYGFPDCTQPTKMKLRWSSRILLQNQTVLEKII